MSKIGLMLHHSLVEEIRSHGDYDDTKADYGNYLMLIGMMKAIESLYNPNGMALLLTLF